MPPFRRGKPIPPQVHRPLSAHRGTGGKEADEPLEFIPEGELREFLSGEAPIGVQSSNVGPLVQYFPAEEKMLVEFHGGKSGPPSTYLYSQVSAREAEDFARADSKGKWVWSNLRVRGSTTRHRKPFVKIR